MHSDTNDVKTAVTLYHAALSSLETTKIEALWAHDDSVMQVEPTSKAVTLGWRAVKKNLENFFGGFSELKVTQADGPHIQVKGDVAWSTGITTAVAKTKAGDALTLHVIDTQIFERRHDTWLVVSNIALQVPQ
jgi:ketosteroid isomerase-like protein